MAFVRVSLSVVFIAPKVVCICIYVHTAAPLARASHVSSSRSVPNPSRARAVHDNAAYDRASTRERRGMCIRI